MEILGLLKPSEGQQPWLVRKIYALPPDFTWGKIDPSNPDKKLSGITLMGDAGHVMSPFAGEGVNLVLLDAVELGAALTKALANAGSADSIKLYSAVDQGLSKFEARMWKRARRCGTESAENLRLSFFAPNAPDGFVDLVKSFSLEVLGRKAASSALKLTAIGVVFLGLRLIR